MENSSDEDLNSDNEFIDFTPLWRDRPFLSDSSTTEEEVEDLLEEILPTPDKVEFSPRVIPHTSQSMISTHVISTPVISAPVISTPVISTPLNLVPANLPSRADRYALEALMAEINEIYPNVIDGRAARQRVIDQFVPSNMQNRINNTPTIIPSQTSRNQRPAASLALNFDEDEYNMFRNSIFPENVSFDPLPDSTPEPPPVRVPERSPVSPVARTPVRPRVHFPDRIPDPIPEYLPERRPFDRLPRRLSQLRNSRNSSIDAPRPIRGRTFISPPRYAHGRQSYSPVLPTFSRLIDSPPIPLDNDNVSTFSRLIENPIPQTSATPQLPRVVAMHPIRPISRFRSISQGRSTPQGRLIPQGRPITQSHSTQQARRIQAPILPQIEDLIFEDTPAEIEETRFVLPAALREKEKDAELDEVTRAYRAALVIELLMPSPKGRTSRSDPKKSSFFGLKNKENDSNKKHKQ